MNKVRKKANFRKKLAIFFFALLFINIILKLTGVSTLDTEQAINASQALGMKLVYYVTPLMFLLLGLLFNYLGKAKSLEAETYELGGASW